MNLVERHPEPVDEVALEQAVMPEHLEGTAPPGIGERDAAVRHPLDQAELVQEPDLRELLLNPDFVPAPRALEIGLVNRVVPRAELEAAGTALAGEILGKASGESIARTKRLLLALPGLTLDERLALAAETNALARATADCRRGISTFLAEKRTPDWRTPGAS